VHPQLTPLFQSSDLGRDICKSEHGLFGDVQRRRDDLMQGLACVLTQVCSKN
jgi:hypothetical protein